MGNRELDSVAPSNGYVLVICEKPDAARRVSEALSDDELQASRASGMTVYRFNAGPKEFVVCSALGHLFSVSDPFAERSVYPTFDTEWFPLDALDTKNVGVKGRIAAMRKLAQGASQVVNACDFDVEGETIGFNILKYACQGRETDSVRVRFSSLTRRDISEAFMAPVPQRTEGLAAAGRARHLIDFIWGVNLSRALSRSGSRYRTVSIGRVQGPTLRFLAEKERRISEFEPRRYWRATVVFRNGQTQFAMPHSKGRLLLQSEAEKVKNECMGKKGVVKARRKKLIGIPPFPPFNTGDLQKEAYRTYHFSPAQTMRSAEKLYLAALVSYPRTESQRLPPSIDLKAILHGLQNQPTYAEEAKTLFVGRAEPREGTKVDRAHPAIHPTGECPERRLDTPETKLYDLIVRRFLACLAPAAKRESVSLCVSVGEHEFRLDGGKTIERGWIDYYGKYCTPNEVDVPLLEVGEQLEVVTVKVEGGIEERTNRYNQASLLEKMEHERIGTKSTRADTISTLLQRGYVAGDPLVLTELGLTVSRILEENARTIASTELTRTVEERLEAVEEGREDEKELLRETVRSVVQELVGLAANEDSIGRRIDGAAETVDAAIVLGTCPVCGVGKLRIIRSRRTRKRFLGCSNYSAGCRATAPLPQRGDLKNPTSCPLCSWPVVDVVGRWQPWRTCVNPRCHSNQGRFHVRIRGQTSPGARRDLEVPLDRVKTNGQNAFRAKRSVSGRSIG